MTTTTDHGNVDSPTVANASIDDATVEEVDTEHEDADDDDAITATFEWKNLHNFALLPSHSTSESWLFNPYAPGKVVLIDGRTGSKSPPSGFGSGLRG